MRWVFRILWVSLWVGVAAVIVAQNVLPLWGLTRSRTRMDIAALEAAREAWHRDRGCWPESVAQLVLPDAGGAPYLKDRLDVPLDPWKRPYHYVETPGGPLLFSLGEDGDPWGDPDDGDVANWWRFVGAE